MAVTGTAQSGSPDFIKALNTLERIKQSMPVYGLCRWPASIWNTEQSRKYQTCLPLQQMHVPRLKTVLRMRLIQHRHL